MTKGMTLIELVVTIGIVMLLLLAGIPSYNHFANVNNLNQAADDVKSAILDTQSLALSPQENLNEAVPDQYDGYIIEFSNTSPEYYIYQVKINSDPLVKNSMPVKVFSLPTGINFGNSQNIQFSIANQGKIVACSETKRVAIVSDKLTLDNTKNINVNCATGQITTNTP
ncbi:MAG: prepilin-type N-terminal cleavage/methylation domain-containing protein [Patescibacteria group bacterium]|nr:prepilin-type N-terminal cleavage/methylation domain-containing protein [Patescibacteria group bacterium]